MSEEEKLKEGTNFLYSHLFSVTQFNCSFFIGLALKNLCDLIFSINDPLLTDLIEGKYYFYFEIHILCY